MRILFTGATGVIGRLAVPLLIDSGHQVDAVYRSPDDGEWLAAIGARPIPLDLFDSGAIRTAVTPVDAVAHFATSIPSLAAMKKRSAWVSNDRLRRETTKHLIDAALAAQTRVFVQESITFTYADNGADWIDESDLIEPPWEVTQSALDAEAETARFAAAGRNGVVLRMAGLYGPGDASREYVGGVAAGKIPIIGSGRNYVSSLATSDAATAVVAALDTKAGVYNIADDQPVTSAELLRTLADRLGAPRPRKVPRLVARIVVGGATNLMTRSHRIDNRLFKKTTGWQPAYPSIIVGWDHAMAKSAAP